MNKKLAFYLTLLIPIGWLFLMAQNFVGTLSGFALLMASLPEYEFALRAVQTNLQLISFGFLIAFGVSLYVFAKLPEEDNQ